MPIESWGTTLQELCLTAQQEIGNAWFAARPPRLAGDATRRVVLLPDPDPALDRVRRSGFGDEIVRLAELALVGVYQLFGHTMELGTPPHWRREIVHGQELPLDYFRRVPFLDAASVGDARLVWELNRHQHWVILAQAWRLTRRPEFLSAITAELADWQEQNPLHKGINWTNTREVAIRALQWIWVDHLAGEHLGEPARQSLVEGLYQHGHHLFLNSSARGVDLLAESVALHAMATAYPDLPRAMPWRTQAQEMIELEVRRHVRADGMHAGQSTHRHLYALDVLLLHYLLAGRPAHLQGALEKMAECLHALMGSARRLPCVGDDDGGRVFHPYGSQDQFGRATLATCSRLFGRPEWLASGEDLLPQAAWWLGEMAYGGSTGYAKPCSRVFPDAGLAVLSRGRFWMLFDCGAFGPGPARHSHSDTLSVVLRVGDTDILIDPGTYTLFEPEWRRRFNGSGAHNTIRVDRQDQATFAGHAGWSDKPSVRIVSADTNTSTDRVTGEWSGAGGRHTRSVELEEDGLLIRDTVELPPGEHLVEQFWHPGLPAVPFAPTCFRIGPYAEIVFRTPGSTVSYEQGHECGWRSPAYSHREEAPVLCVSWRGSGRVEFETEITLV